MSVLRRGRWEEHDLTPATFGKDLGPNLHGSSCNRTKSRCLGPSTGDYYTGLSLISVLARALAEGRRFEKVVFLFSRLVLNYQEVLGSANFKLM